MKTLVYYSTSGAFGHMIPFMVVSGQYGVPIPPEFGEDIDLLSNNPVRRSLREAAWQSTDSAERKAARLALIDWYEEHGIPSKEEAMATTTEEEKP